MLLVVSWLLVGGGVWRAHWRLEWRAAADWSLHSPVCDDQRWCLITQHDHHSSINSRLSLCSAPPPAELCQEEADLPGRNLPYRRLRGLAGRPGVMWGKWRSQHWDIICCRPVYQPHCWLWRMSTTTKIFWPTTILTWQPRMTRSGLLHYISLSVCHHWLLIIIILSQCDSGLGAYRLYELIYQEKDQKVGDNF